VPTARNVGRSSGRVRRQACGLPYPASGRRSRPPALSQQVFQHVYHGAGDPAAARRFTRPSARDVDQLSSGVRQGEAEIHGPSSGGHCTSPVALPPYPPPAVFGAPPPAMTIVRRRQWGTVIGRERRRVRPAIAPPLTPPPAIQLRSRM